MKKTRPECNSCVISFTPSIHMALVHPIVFCHAQHHLLLVLHPFIMCPVCTTASVLPLIPPVSNLLQNRCIGHSCSPWNSTISKASIFSPLLPYCQHHLSHLPIYFPCKHHLRNPKTSMQGSKFVVAMVANATIFSHLLPGCSCGSKHLLLP